jgi:hypothetical protein
MGKKCEGYSEKSGRATTLGPEKPELHIYYSRGGLCARCYRKKYKRFPWPNDPRDEPDHPDYAGVRRD